MASLTIIGCLVPFDNPLLLTAQYSTDMKASPFVIAVQNAGIGVIPSILNAVVLISVLSVANSSVYGSTRIIQALAERGQAPRVFAYIDKRGRPLVALLVILLVGLLAFIGISPQLESELFNWLVSFTALSAFFTW